jgi:hypothetical protein
MTRESNLAADVDKIMSYIALSEPFASAALPTDRFTIMALESRYTSPESLRHMLTKLDKRLVITSLIVAHVAAVCLAIAYASRFHPELIFGGPGHGSLTPTIILLMSLPLALIFGLAEFSFGYLVSFYLYQMLAGFLFLNTFTGRSYDHDLAAASAFGSVILFLIPALFLHPRPKLPFTLSCRAFDAVLALILLLAFLTILAAAIYNFRIEYGSLTELRTELSTARLRGELRFPTPVRYAIGIFSTALLPFAFACFLLRRQHWKAAASLVLMALFFPITLSKTTLFAPAWLLFVAALAKMFEARIAAIASLSFPLLIAVLTVDIAPQPNYVFDLLAFRMIDIPSAALDVYNEFFAHHELTYFCQLSLTNVLVTCPYQEQLGVVMAKTYGFGNYNASLFATEGIASVGLVLAPVSALACGLVIALGNCLSGRLPSAIVLISSSVLCQAILNVPLSTAIVTHGGGLLFLLWCISPPEAFRKKPASS